MLGVRFTTVRDVGNAGNYADGLRRAIDELVPGPPSSTRRIIAPYGGTTGSRERPTFNSEYRYADTR